VENLPAIVGDDLHDPQPLPHQHPPQPHGWGAAYAPWTFLEAGQEDLMEEAGVVKVPCDNCGYLALFDAETLGIRGLWAEGREL
jgi:hypothetical protein